MKFICGNFFFDRLMKINDNDEKKNLDKQKFNYYAFLFHISNHRSNTSKMKCNEWKAKIIYRWNEESETWNTWIKKLTKFKQINERTKPLHKYYGNPSIQPKNQNQQKNYYHYYRKQHHGIIISDMKSFYFVLFVKPIYAWCFLGDEIHHQLMMMMILGVEAK